MKPVYRETDSFGNEDFPDSRIGASLKPRPKFPKLYGIHPDFPDSRIGASLKHAHLQVHVARHLTLPRFANRGLIEAP